MGARIEVRMPADGQEGTRARVLRWLKRVGDSVAVDEPLLEVETDKVTVEVSSPARGIVREIAKSEDQDVGPDELLGWVDSVDEVAGSTESHATKEEDEVPVQTDSSRAGHKLSPAVRRMLAENRLDASSIRGSGKDGRITAGDVLRHVESKQTSVAKSESISVVPVEATPVARPAETPVGKPGPTAAGKSETTPSARDTALRETPGSNQAALSERIPHPALRRRIAERMVESVRTSPHVTTVFEVDLGAVMTHRERHRDTLQRHGVPLTLTAYFALACVDAIRSVPETNARWTEDALEVYRNVDIGIATAIEDRGLVVPILRNVEGSSLFRIAEQLHDLTRRAREDKLTPADVRGGTFTISNHGVSGSLVATPIIINQPQTAILGIGKLEKRAVVVTHDGVDSIAIRPRCYVTLTIDHRVMDGHRANQFLSTYAKRLEQWTD
jgi:2-oxoglutarate dehydrogenase E2 component (dihydrolipoamide succinyltransferase)